MMNDKQIIIRRYTIYIRTKNILTFSGFIKSSTCPTISHIYVIKHNSIYTLSTRYLHTIYSISTHHPGLVAGPVECELLLDPGVDHVERHPLLGDGQRQADQRRVGVRRLGHLVIREVQQLQQIFLYSLYIFFS